MSSCNVNEYDEVVSLRAANAQIYSEELAKHNREMMTTQPITSFFS